MLLSLGVLTAGASARTEVKLRPSRPLSLGFASDTVLTTQAPSVRDFWLSKAQSEGARFVRVDVNWSQIAPNVRPLDPPDPASPGYYWAGLDDIVRQDAAHGMNILIMMYVAPVWAEAPNIPHHVGLGSYKPNPAALADFTTAMARRYSGTYPDPEHPGAFLPRVRYWQPWNEPNLASYLSPQWTQTKSGFVPASPAIYRTMLDKVYAAVKTVDPSNVVVSAGTAPYGDPPGHDRMQPVAFYRSLLCVNEKLRPLSCGRKTYADAFDHHPYELNNAPDRRAVNPDDVAVPDIWKIERVLKAGVQAGHLLPHGNKPMWITELGWDSNPPIKLYSGVPLNTQARYIEQANYLLWRQHVQVVLNFQIRDINRAVTRYQHVFDGTGVFFNNGSPKPSATAFRFPLVVSDKSRNERVVWMRAPVSGRLVLSRQLGNGSWATIGTAQAKAMQVLVGTVKLSGRATLRARIGSSVSLTWVSR